MIYVQENSSLITSKMLPSSKWKLTENLVEYSTDSQMKAQFDRKILLDDPKPRDVMHSIRPTLIIDSILEPTLPEPGRENPRTLASNPLMFLRPNIKRARHHAAEKGCLCTVVGLRDSHHRELVIPDSCVREQYPRPKPARLLFSENPGRVYTWDKVLEDHVLIFPQPFLVAAKWPAKEYEPAMALCRDRLQTRLYYSLYDSGRFTEMAQLYSTPSSEWSASGHPYFGEPSRNSELGRVTEAMHGLETLLRTGFAGHPCAEESIPVYAAADRVTLRVPVLKNCEGKKGFVEFVLTNLFRPFVTEGRGLVLCPVCLLRASGDRFEPVFLSRSEYPQHWESEHYSSLVAVGVFSATQLHTRIFMGNLLYQQVLLYRGARDTLEGCAICPKFAEEYLVEENFTDVLAKVVKSGQPSDLEVAMLDEEDSMDEVMEISQPEDRTPSIPAGRFLPKKNSRS